MVTPRQSGIRLESSLFCEKFRAIVEESIHPTAAAAVDPCIVCQFPAEIAVGEVVIFDAEVRPIDQIAVGPRSGIVRRIDGSDEVGRQRARRHDNENNHQMVELHLEQIQTVGNSVLVMYT